MMGFRRSHFFLLALCIVLCTVAAWGYLDRQFLQILAALPLPTRAAHASPEPELAGLRAVFTLGIGLAGLIGIALAWVFLRQQTRIRAAQTLEETLRAREEHLSALLDTIPDMVWLKDPNGVYIDANPVTERFMGLPRGSLAGTTDRDHFPPALADALIANDRDAAHAPITIVEHITTPDGQQAWLETTKTAVRDARGRLIGVLGVARNISQARQAQEELRQSESLLRQAQRMAAIGHYNFDVVADHWDSSDTLDAIFGIASDYPRNVLGWLGLVHEADRQATEDYLAVTVLGARQPFDREYRIRRQTDQQVRWVHGLGQLDCDANGRVLRLFGVIQDITERKRVEERQRLAASVFTSSHEGIVITDADATIVDINAAFTQLTGYSREEVLGKRPSVLKSGHQSDEFYAGMWATLVQTGNWCGEVWNRRKDGSVYAELLTISAVRDPGGQTGHYVGIFADITPQKEHQRELEHIAHYDALTGIPNRVLLADRMNQAIAQTRRAEKLMAVCFLDLDGFKPINDRHGHAMGDRLLVEMAQRMRACLRGGDTVARIGGDEFVLLLLGLDRNEEAYAALDRILAAIASPLIVANEVTSISASLGVTLFPQDEADADTLLRHADQAMYQAKQAGKNRYHLFDPERDRLAHARREQLARIERALELGEFELFYQPKVNMRLGVVTGAEALLRWRHPVRGVLAPAEFLPLIEDTDFIVTVGDWVIATALAQLATWRREGIELSVSVNIAPRHLLRQDFVSRLAEHLAAHADVPPDCLELEILESAAIEDIRHVSTVMHECKDLGVHFSLDDFGTGYSSLTYFKRLPTETLKIDQSFVRDMLTDAEDMAIVEGVIGLAGVFRRNVIAEGVETAAHGILLLNLGCEMAQGYGIARPMPAADLPGWVANWQPDPQWASIAGFRWPRDDLPMLIAEGDLRRWVEALVALVETGHTDETADETTDKALECRFGRWYRGSGLHRYGTRVEYAVIGATHDALHALGDALLRQCDAGQRDTAIARLPEIIALRDRLLDQLHALASGALLDF
jgi:diguanylate cyclase (GGDEF)-like protein/PAS domain S-box-containing protein